MATETRMVKVKFTCFKERGKCYSEEEVMVPCEVIVYPGGQTIYTSSIIDWYDTQAETPGIVGKWDGPVLITAEDLVPYLIIR